MKNAQEKYTVYVDDNYHYMDKTARYTQGEYNDYESALKVCKSIVDNFLANSKPGVSAKDMYTSYIIFGEDPWIVGPEGRFFYAWDYAKEQAEKMCKKAVKLEATN